MPSKPTSGNRTARRGSRYIQRVQLSRDAAQTYKINILRRGWEYTPENVAKLAAEYAEAEWREYDTKIQAAAEWDGSVL